MATVQGKFRTAIEPADPSVAALTARTSPYVSCTRYGLSPSSRFASGPRRERLRIAVLAPPWFPVPPLAYGGIEAVVDVLCQELVARGHEVTLFAAPGSHSDARLRTPLEAAHPHEIGSSMVESDCVACAWGEIDLAAELGPAFDVVHDHSGFTALAMADRIAAPVVHTIHGAFVEETAPFYRRHGHKARLVAISRSQALSAPARVRIADVVPNPVVVERWPLRTEKQDYLLWVGRMDPVKGAHRAIRAACLAGRRLVLAGPVQAGQEPHYHRWSNRRSTTSASATSARWAGSRSWGCSPRARSTASTRSMLPTAARAWRLAMDISVIASGYEAVYQRAIQADSRRAGWGRRPARLTRSPLPLGVR